MTFEAPDDALFPGLGLAWHALRAAPGTTAVLNAANEVAVEAFLARRLRFDRIHAVNLETLEARVAIQSDVAGRSARARHTSPRRGAGLCAAACCLTFNSRSTHAHHRCLHRRARIADRRARIRPLPGRGGLRRQGAALFGRLRQDAVSLAAQAAASRPGHRIRDRAPSRSAATSRCWTSARGRAGREEASRLQHPAAAFARSHRRRRADRQPAAGGSALHAGQLDRRAEPAATLGRPVAASLAEQAGLRGGEQIIACRLRWRPGAGAVFRGPALAHDSRRARWP